MKDLESSILALREIRAHHASMVGQFEAGTLHATEKQNGMEVDVSARELTKARATVVSYDEQIKRLEAILPARALLDSAKIPEGVERIG